jgi:hypothetical protein
LFTSVTGACQAGRACAPEGANTFETKFPEFFLIVGPIIISLLCINLEKVSLGGEVEISAVLFQVCFAKEVTKINLARSTGRKGFPTHTNDGNIFRTGASA